MPQQYAMNLAPNRCLALLSESARIHPAHEQPCLDAAAAREERLGALALLDRLHANCATEEPAAAVAAWEGPLGQFGTDELLALLDLSVAEALEAHREERPFHLTAHLCALLMSWTHDALLPLELEGTRDTARALALQEIFEAASTLFTALAQEADARRAANVDDPALPLPVAA